MADAIRVLLVDDHPIVRKGVTQAIAHHGDVAIVGEAGSGEEALYLCRTLAPDVIVMDVQMKGMDGVETTALIRRLHPDVAILGLSTFPQASYIDAMRRAGANGYLLKDIAADDLAAAIRKVHGGDDAFTEPDAGAGPQPAPDPILGAAPVLGDQQRRVLYLMTKGLTNPEIADQLGISTPTARYHVSAILQKLDVSNRAEAVAVALREGLVNAARDG